MSERNVLTAHLRLRPGLTSEQKLDVSRELWNVLIPYLAREDGSTMTWRGENGEIDVTDLVQQ